MPARDVNRHFAPPSGGLPSRSSWNDDGSLRDELTSVSVVLSGGGLRGPFQAGALAGLEAAGVRIDAIAGTSIGALNALAFARIGGALMVDHWIAIARRRLLSVNVLGLALRVILFLLAGPHIAWFLLFHYRDDRLTPAARGLRAPSWLRYLIEELELTQPPGAQYTNRTTGNVLATISIIYFVALLLLLGSIAQLTGVSLPDVRSLAPWQAIVLLVLVVMSALGLNEASGPAMRHLNSKGIAFLDSAIRQNLPKHSNRVPPKTYVCVSTDKTAFDYRTLRGYYTDIPRGNAIAFSAALDFGRWDPILRRSLTPQYVRIDELADADQDAIAVASAALPLGLLGCVKHAGQLLFDGGIVDNVPIYPLAQAGHGHVLIVDISRYGLGPRASDEIVAHLDKCRYLLHISSEPELLARRAFRICSAGRRVGKTFHATHARIISKLDAALACRDQLLKAVPQIDIIRPARRLPWYSLVLASSKTTEQLIEDGKAQGYELGLRLRKVLANTNSADAAWLPRPDEPT